MPGLSLWRRLRIRLLLTYLLVIGAGALTVVLTTNLVAPGFYDIHLAGMMGPGGMMGGPGGIAGPGAMRQSLDAPLRAAYQQAVFQSVLAGGAVAVVVAVLVSLLVSDRIAGPVQRLVSAAQRIAAGHYAERVPVPGGTAGAPDEVGLLAATFNEMAASLEETERRRVDLLGDVAHELRTPINTLQGYLEGLLDGVIQPSPALWAQMHREAGRMQRLVNDLRDLSRAEARQLSLNIEALDPTSLTQAAVARLQPHYAEKGLELRQEVAPDLPLVRADRDRAVQVLTNLLDNALRYTPAPGSVTLTVAGVRGAQGREVLFQVADTGIGIAPEHLPHLFERFYRVDKSRTRAAGGSGIGLTIVQVLVQAMGGRVWAASPGPDQGSAVSFTLPTPP